MHSFGPPNSLTQMLTLRPLTVDDLSAARYVHAAAFSGSGGDYYETQHVDAFVGFIRSARYADLMLGTNAVAAWLDTEMVGLAAWSPGEQASPTARILALCVRPLFTGEGIGRLLLDHVEEEARNAGYPALEVAATLNTVGFFDTLGFRAVRHGEWTLPLGHEIPVTYMRKAEFTGLRLVT